MAKPAAAEPVLTGRRDFTLQVHLDNYIAHPYWPEREKVINISKESGMSRARSATNRRRALEEYLKANDMTYADYERLVALAERPFYKDAAGQIIVPQLHVISMVVAMCDSIRAAGKPVAADQVRSAVRVSDWSTGKSEPDGIWERFAVVTAGTGAKLSNQRALRANPYIEDCVCEGVMSMSETMVSPDKMRTALQYAGSEVGIGASRKMGWGRFQVLDFS